MTRFHVIEHLLTKIYLTKLLLTKLPLIRTTILIGKGNYRLLCQKTSFIFILVQSASDILAGLLLIPSVKQSSILDFHVTQLERVSYIIIAPSILNGYQPNQALIPLVENIAFKNGEKQEQTLEIEKTNNQDK